jgi:hypothetical protein
LLHAIVHSASIQDRDGGILLLATLFGQFPFLVKLFADSAYQGPTFSNALAKILPCLDTEIIKRSAQAKGFVQLPKRIACRVVRHEFRAPPNELRTITVDGDSMEPLLPSGDRILIDTSQRVPVPPGTRPAHSIRNRRASDARVDYSSETTVKTHLQRAFEKTASRRQADLVELVAGYMSPLT